MNFWTFVLGFGVLQGLFLGVIFYTSRKEKNIGGYLLGTLLIVISIISAEYVLSNLGFHIKYPAIIFISGSFWYLIFPLLYLYIGSSFRNLKWSWVLLLHSVPFFVNLINNIPFYIMDGELKIRYITHYSETGEIAAAHLFFKSLYFIQAFIYLFFSFKKLTTSSNQENKRLKLMTNILKGVFVYMLVSLSQSLIHIGFKIIWAIPTYLSLSFFTLFIHSIAYIAIKSPANLSLFASIKHSTSNLHGLDIDTLKQKLKSILSNEKFFKEPDLKLKDLAERLNISTHQASELINKELQTSFYDLINYYRIEQAKEILVDPNSVHLSFLGIAMEVGFNNNASFYRAFKKSTGMSPSQFLNINKRIA